MMGGNNEIVRGKIENSEKSVQFKVVQLLRPFLHYHYDVYAELYQFSYCSSWIVPALLVLYLAAEALLSFGIISLHSTIERRFESKKYMW
jgi:hypothetical protein